MMMLMVWAVVRDDDDGDVRGSDDVEGLFGALQRVRAFGRDGDEGQEEAEERERCRM